MGSHTLQRKIKEFLATSGQSIKFGTDDNYFDVDGDGDVTFIGDATVWDDFRSELTPGRLGALSKPDYDYTNLGMLFPRNDATEIASFVIQMSHQKKLNTDVKFHIHYIQSGAVKPTFKMDYKFYLNGATVPAGWTTISTASGSKGIFDYSSGSLLQIATFPSITPPANETVSANIDIKLYRDDNDATGDVLAKYFDCHFQKDTVGSREEYSK